MLIFDCSNCDETINAANDESPAQIIDKLNTHIMSCPLARFTYHGTTDTAWQGLNNLRAAIEDLRPAGKIRLY